MITLRDAIRRVDPDQVITVGLVDWSLDHPGKLFSGITPAVVAAELDFVAVHLYPEKGEIDENLATLRQFQIGDRPLIVEETFPLKANGAEFARFADAVRDSPAGLVGFYLGQDQTTLQQLKTIPAALTADWLDDFEHASSRQIP